ncbi:hypothetical protein SAMN04487948_11328 [Halogranum amylolyticum]|uniref:Uncharacterized protein n=1 Tax=Halogranum amylolyticum TaxID=660520 RepID=A0A1H8UXZ9_9EURY|nr:hypothetical protein SAMN04487948_11328 [Halogranum amylolyticum]
MAIRASSAGERVFRGLYRVRWYCECFLAVTRCRSHPVWAPRCCWVRLLWLCLESVGVCIASKSACSLVDRPLFSLASNVAMRSVWSRRRLLSVVSLCGLSALAGCSLNPLRSRQLAHEVEVFNYSDRTHNIHYQVDTAAGTILVDHLYRLESNTAREATEPFVGTPARIIVPIDGRRPETFAWPQPDCDAQGVRSAGGVRFAYGFEEAAAIGISPTCETVSLG